ncbi:MAG TPA: hypothetical protein VI911_09115 [Patescibacteria group bacterium]|nr:hypothetical protein [Patescibacteria group bacterium]
MNNEKIKKVNNMKFEFLRTKYLMLVAKLTYIKMTYDLEDKDTIYMIEKFENLINCFKKIIARRDQQRIFIKD